MLLVGNLLLFKLFNNSSGIRELYAYSSIHKHFDLLTKNDIKRWVKFTGKPCPKLIMGLVERDIFTQELRLCHKLKFSNLYIFEF